MNQSDPSVTAGEYGARVAASSVYCRSIGDGPALVWGHGLLSSMAHEDASGVFDFSLLADEGHRWVRYDARGHGYSPDDLQAGHFEWPGLARDMLAVADRSDLQHFAAGGASMGCATALWCAHIEPDRVDKLVLALPPTAWNWRDRQRALYRTISVASRLRLTLPLHLARRILPTGSSGSASRNGYVQSSLRSIAGMRPGQVAAALEGAAASDLPAREAIEAIRHPALILAWPNDRAHPVAVADMLATTLPNATLHMAHGDDDVALWPSVVAEFLR